MISDELISSARILFGKDWVETLSHTATNFESTIGAKRLLDRVHIGAERVQRNLLAQSVGKVRQKGNGVIATALALILGPSAH